MVIVQIHVSEIAAVETLGDVKRFRLRMAFHVEPALVVEARAVHHQGVSVPMPDRVAEPGGIGIFRELAAVGKDGSINAIGAALIEKRNQSRSLDNPS